MVNVAYLLLHFALFARYLGFLAALPFVGTFYGVGNSMTHIKLKYGILAAVLTHYGITFAAISLALYLQLSLHVRFS